MSSGAWPPSWIAQWNLHPWRILVIPDFNLAWATCFGNTWVNGTLTAALFQPPGDTRGRPVWFHEVHFSPGPIEGMHYWDPIAGDHLDIERTDFDDYYQGIIWLGYEAHVLVPYI